MVGRSLENKFPPKQNFPTTEKLLEVHNINRAGILHDISFDLYRGEILGIAGLMGAGRSELGRAIFGADPINSGDVIMNGLKLSLKSPSDAINAGIAYLSENRKEEGLAVKMLLTEKRYNGKCRGYIPAFRNTVTQSRNGRHPKICQGSQNQNTQSLSGCKQSFRGKSAEGGSGKMAVL